MASNDTASGGSEISETNIKVFIRVRPPDLKEDPTYSRVVEVSPCRKSIILQNNPAPRTFSFDHVADVDETQDDVFTNLGRKIIESCLAGYNGTIFAYGQTGSGKTFTMLGPPEDADNFHHELRGVIPRSFEYLYSMIGREKELHGENKQFLCKCSFLEIYNEQIFDLLEPTTTSLHLRESFKTGVYVSGLSEQVVSNAAEAYQVLNSSWINRRVASTSMNRESSRSHAVFTLHIESKEKKGSVEHIKTSHLNLVDLAGSERQKDSGAVGIRLKEASSINKSLSNLGNVIMSLVTNSTGTKRYIPYRDSKLTFLLRDSLGGNSKTSLIACVHSGHRCYGETLSTLQFAKRTKMIKNKAVLNEDAHGNIHQLQAEIRTLKDEIRVLKVDGMPRAVSEAGSPVDGPFIYKEMFLQAMQLHQRTEQEKMELLTEIEQIKDVCSKKDKVLQSTRMIIKFRENNIARLQAQINDTEPTDTHVDDLRREVQILQSHVDHHPQVAKYSMEIQKLKAKLKASRADGGGQESLEADVKRIQALEARFRELVAEQHDGQSDEPISTPQRTEAVSTATVERLRSQVADLETENSELKQSQCESKQAAEKREVYLTSEIESLKQSVQELETVLAANRTKNKLERDAINESHLQTVKTMTTPKKERYRLRSRTVVSTNMMTPDLDLSIPFEAPGEEEEEEEGISQEDEPEALVEQAQEALMEQLKQLQDTNTRLDVQLAEYEADRVKQTQQQSMLELQLQQVEEMLSKEKEEKEQLSSQMSKADKKLKDTVLDQETTTSEILDLRTCLKSADRECNEYKRRRRELEVTKKHELEKVESKIIEVEIVLANLTKENDLLAEERDALQMYLETESATISFQEDRMRGLEGQIMDRDAAIKELQQNIQIAEKAVIDERDHKELLLAQLTDEGVEKEQAMLSTMEEVKSLQVECGSLRNMTDVQDETAALLRAELEARDSKIAALEKTVAHAEGKISVLYARLTAEGEEACELRQALAQLEERVAWLVRQEQEAAERVAALEQAAIAQDEDNRRATSKLTVQVEMSNEDLLQAQSTNDELKKEYDISTQEVAASQQKLEALQTEMKKLQESLRKKEAESARLNTTELELSMLNEQLTELQDVREQRNRNITELKAKLREVETSKNSVTAEYQKLFSDHAETLSSLERSKDEMAALYSQVVDTQTSALEYGDRLSACETERDSIQQRFTELVETCEEQERLNVELSETTKRLTELAEKDNVEKQQLNTELHTAKLVLNKIQMLYVENLCPDTTSIEDLVLAIQNTKHDYNKLVEENIHLVGHNNSQQKIKHFEKVKMENIYLKKELVDVRAQMQKAQQALLEEKGKWCHDRHDGSTRPLKGLPEDSERTRIPEHVLADKENVTPKKTVECSQANHS